MQSKLIPVSHWTYSTYYFASISIYAFTLGYLPLHYEEIGFSAAQIAFVSAATNLASILASPSSLQLAHSFITPRKLLGIFLSIALVAYLPLTLTENFLLLTIAWALCCFCKRAADALVDAQAIRAATAGEIEFERARSWGSIGFVAVMFALGALTDSVGRSVIIPAGLLIVFSTLLVSLRMRKYLRAEPEPKKHEIEESDTNPTDNKYRARFIALLLSVGLIWASHSMMYVYLSLYLDTLGWSASQISLAWNIGVIAEVIFFFSFKHWQNKLSLKSVYLLGIYASLLRWLILYYFDDFYILMGSQVLHGLSFGAAYIASIRLTHEILPERLKDRGQGLLYGFGVGVGALLGRFHAGYVAADIESYREVQGLFMQSFCIALLALVAAYFIRTNRAQTALTP